MTEKTIERLVANRHLKFLSLSKNKVSMHMFKEVAKITGLEDLRLNKSTFESEALVALTTSRSIYLVDFAECNQFTDESLKNLAPLNSLKQVHAKSTKITSAGFKWWLKHRPDCDLIGDDHLIRKGNLL